MDDIGSLVKRPTFTLKLVELILAIICSAIVGNSGLALSVPKSHVGFVAIHGYMIVNLICILSFLMKTHLHKNITVMIAVTGAGLYFAAGGFMLELYDKVPSSIFGNVDYALGSGICALINGAVYIADAVFSFREGGSS